MPDTVQITMPQMGESVSEGTVLTWHKQEGDWVEKDETLVEVSTDKVDAEVPSPAAGKLVKILAQEDETIEVGQPLAELEPGEGEQLPPAAKAADGSAEGAVTPEPREPGASEAERSTDGGGAAPPGPGAAGARSTDGGRAPTPVPVAEGDARSTPVARRAAAAHGIDLSEVSGSGTGGRI